jgi:drug/metabolite transporter (DMT)-like permease
MSMVHFHLLLSHVPVIGILFALVLFAAAILLRETVSTRFALGFSAALAVVAVAVYFTGGPAEEAVENLAGVTERAIEQHEESAQLTTIAMSILGALSLAALVIFRGKRMPRWLAVSGVVGTIVLSALMGWTANLGGQIRHTEIGSTDSQRGGGESDDD